MNFRKRERERENEEGKLFRGFLVERERMKNDDGSTWAYQKVFFPKCRENLMGKNLMSKGQKCPCANCTRASILVVFFF